jgi:NitT/TauT family transport system substrate-binding protein
MTSLIRWFFTLALVAAGAGLTQGASAADKIRVAFGDVPSVESLNMLIAFERAKARGVEIELMSVKEEDIAAQAVVTGEADVGVGTPYALLQKVKAPIRMFFQMSALRFYPVVNSEFYKDWKDLDGQEVAVQGRGTGTEAIMKLMAQKNGITFSNISYVPGSEVRAGALLQGTIKASIVDAANRRLLEQKAPGKFTTLPMEGVNASDEALYANEEFLKSNAAAIDVLVEELIRTWREIDADPKAVAKLRAEYKLDEVYALELPEELSAEIEPYYTEATAAGTFSLNGGSPEAVQNDFEFYALAGQLEGDASSLKAEDFWDFGPQERALAKLGKK